MNQQPTIQPVSQNTVAAVVAGSIIVVTGAFLIWALTRKK